MATNDKNHIIQSIPEPTLRRLPWYLAYVTMLNHRGVEHVSSTRIAGDLNVEASQIAKDLSYLNIRGKTRIGYEVASLEKVLSAYLGFENSHKAVVVGVGSLGGALMRDSGLMKYGLDIVAGFDIDPAKTGTDIAGCPIHHISRLAEISNTKGVSVAIITVPYDQSASMAQACIDAGIKGLWNFTPARLVAHPGVIIQNTSIYSDLAVIYNRL